MDDHGVFNQLPSTSFDDDEFFTAADTVNNTSFTDNNGFFSGSTSSANLFFNNPNQPTVSAFTLSFDNSTIIPIKNEPPYDLTKTPSSSPSKRTRATRNSQPRNKSRSSSEVIHHIIAERKRRQDLNQKFIALAAAIPGLKKMDKATVLCEAIDYVRRLQERVRELENIEEKRKRKEGGTVLRKERDSTELCWCRRRAQEGIELPEMEAKVSENQVLIRIHCEKRGDMMLQMVEILEHVHLSVLCCSSLAFGNSAFSITIVAQMEDKYNMKVNDLIKYLRQHMFKSRDDVR